MLSILKKSIMWLQNILRLIREWNFLNDNWPLRKPKQRNLRKMNKITFKRSICLSTTWMKFTVNSKTKRQPPLFLHWTRKEIPHHWEIAHYLRTDLQVCILLGLKQVTIKATRMTCLQLPPIVLLPENPKINNNS